MPVKFTPSASSPASWVRKWYMDPQNDGAAVDIKGGGTYTDDSGITWSTGGGQVTGDSNAASIDIVANTALRIVTSGSAGNIVFARPIVDLLADYAVTDRILFLVHMTAPTLPNTNDRAGMLWKDTDDSERHRLMNENTSGGNTRAQRRTNSSNQESNRRNAVSPVLGLELWNLSCRMYYADTFPTSSNPVDDLTYTCDSALNIGPQNAVPISASTDELCPAFVRRNGAANITIDYLHAALYRWEVA